MWEGKTHLLLQAQRIAGLRARMHRDHALTCQQRKWCFSRMVLSCFLFTPVQPGHRWLVCPKSASGAYEPTDPNLFNKASSGCPPVLLPCPLPQIPFPYRVCLSHAMRGVP